jgi:protein transport protein SEC20
LLSETADTLPEESTRTLTSTHALYDTYTSILHTSGQLVRAIEKADWYDRLLIFSAFGLFLLVVAYVIKRRVLDRVVGGVAGGLGWWIGGSVRLVRMGLGGGTGKGTGGGALAGADGLHGLTRGGQQVGGVSGGMGSVERGKTAPGNVDAGSVLDVVPDEKPGSSAVSPGESSPDEQLQDPSPPIASAVANPHRDEL